MKVHSLTSLLPDQTYKSVEELPKLQKIFFEGRSSVALDKKNLTIPLKHQVFCAITLASFFGYSYLPSSLTAIGSAVQTFLGLKVLIGCFQNPTQENAFSAASYLLKFSPLKNLSHGFFAYNMTLEALELGISSLKQLDEENQWFVARNLLVYGVNGFSSVYQFSGSVLNFLFTDQTTSFPGGIEGAKQTLCGKTCPSDWTEKTIEKQFRQQAKFVHPDKGGNEADFINLEKAKGFLLENINKPRLSDLSFHFLSNLVRKTADSVSTIFDFGRTLDKYLSFPSATALNSCHSLQKTGDFFIEDFFGCFNEDDSRRRLEVLLSSVPHSHRNLIDSRIKNFADDFLPFVTVDEVSYLNPEQLEIALSSSQQIRHFLLKDLSLLDMVELIQWGVSLDTIAQYSKDKILQLQSLLFAIHPEHRMLIASKSRELVGAFLDSVKLDQILRLNRSELELLLPNLSIIPSFLVKGVSFEDVIKLLELGVSLDSVSEYDKYQIISLRNLMSVNSVERNVIIANKLGGVFPRFLVLVRPQEVGRLDISDLQRALSNSKAVASFLDIGVSLFDTLDLIKAGVSLDTILYFGKDKILALKSLLFQSSADQRIVIGNRAAEFLDAYYGRIKNQEIFSLDSRQLETALSHSKEVRLFLDNGIELKNAIEFIQLGISLESISEYSKDPDRMYFLRYLFSGTGSSPERKRMIANKMNDLDFDFLHLVRIQAINALDDKQLEIVLSNSKEMKSFLNKGIELEDAAEFVELGLSFNSISTYSKDTFFKLKLLLLHSSPDRKRLIVNKLGEFFNLVLDLVEIPEIRVLDDKHLEIALSHSKELRPFLENGIELKGAIEFIQSGLSFERIFKYRKDRYLLNLLRSFLSGSSPEREILIDNGEGKLFPRFLDLVTAEEVSRLDISKIKMALFHSKEIERFVENGIELKDAIEFVQLGVSFERIFRYRKDRELLDVLRRLLSVGSPKHKMLIANEAGNLDPLFLRLVKPEEVCALDILELEIVLSNSKVVASFLDIGVSLFDTVELIKSGVSLDTILDYGKDKILALKS